MEVGNKVTTDTGVVLEAKEAKYPNICRGCYFYNDGECDVLDVDRPKRPQCWDSTGNNLIFVKSEDNESR